LLHTYIYVEHVVCPFYKNLLHSKLACPKKCKENLASVKSIYKSVFV
jgi:hypothetical protein